MATYGTRTSRAIGSSDKAFGGAGMNLPVACLEGEGDMVGVFDDFNGSVRSHTFGIGAGLGLQGMGWVLTDVGSPSNDTIHMNDPLAGVSNWDSCLVMTAGDTNDTGGNAQLDAEASTDANVASAPENRHNFRHIWIPETGAGVAVLDNRDFVFACRVGLKTSDADGAWDGKVFIGWAESGDASIMTPATGVLTATNPQVGFHIPEDGSIDGVSQRTAGTAYAAGTNFTELLVAGTVDSTVANGAATVGDTMWFDLALRMNITNMSDAAANGTTTFYHRGPLNRQSPTAAGRDQLDSPGQGYAPWLEHTTVLTDQTPSNDVALVPTIEIINGAVETADVELFLDWWAFGTSRVSR